MTFPSSIKIEKPVFIIGNIRSGTTVLYNLLACHPDVCWFSNYTNRRPDLGTLAWLHRMLDLPVIGKNMKRSIIASERVRSFMPMPHEGDEIYHSYCGFGRDPGGIEKHLTEEMEARLKTKIRQHLGATGKKRFLSKQTANNRRLELLDTMFPDARYVHVIRDGRAVASSTLRVPWWNETHVWWLGYKASEWAARGREPVELAALYWKRTLEEIWRNKSLFGDRYIEVRYEDLAQDTRGVIAGILDFTDLEKHGAYMELLPPGLTNMNYKWREHLRENEKAILREVIGELLEELGYPD